MSIKIFVIAGTLSSGLFCACAAQVGPAIIDDAAPIISSPSDAPIVPPTPARSEQVVVNYKEDSALRQVFETYLTDKSGAESAWKAYWAEHYSTYTAMSAPKLVRFSRGSNLILETQSPQHSSQIKYALEKNSDINYVSAEKRAYKQY